MTTIAEKVEKTQLNKNIHALIDDIVTLANYTDEQIGDVAQLGEATTLVEAITKLTTAVNALTTKLDGHVEAIAAVSEEE